MNLKTPTAILISGLLFFTACQKDTDVFVPNQGQLNGPDTAWYGAVTQNMPVANLTGNLFPEAFRDSFEVNNSAITLNTPFGLQISFPAHCCVNINSQPVTGMVTADVMLLKTKGDFIRVNRPTTSTNKLLVSSGEIFVSLKKNGQSLQMAPGLRYSMRYSDAPPSSGMKFFVGDESNPAFYNWLSNPDANVNTVSYNTQSIEINTNRFNWINTGYVYDTTTNNRVTVTADLASYFTNSNTVAYVVFKDLKSVAGMYGDISNRRFTATDLPVGKNITIVIISRQGNDYFLGFTSTVTALPAGSASQVIAVKPIKRSLSDILYYLKTL